MRALFLLLLSLSASAEFRGTVIYGDDNRIDAHEANNPFLHSLAESSVAFVPADSISPGRNGGFTIHGPVFGKSKRLCPEERFFHQQTPAFCSGVLYGAWKGMNLKESIELATASAACSLSQAGATEGMRTAEEAMKVYNELR